MESSTTRAEEPSTISYHVTETWEIQELQSRRSMTNVACLVILAATLGSPIEVEGHESQQVNQ